MRRHPEYIIPFSSYSVGTHEFEFEVTDRFFENFPDCELTPALLKVNVTMIRSEQLLEFGIRLSGTVTLECDRCLEEFTQPLDASYRLYAKFGHGRNDDEYDVIWIAYGDHQVDMTQHLYEYIVLSLPVRRVHPDLKPGIPGCNPEMLSLLDSMSVGDE